MEKRSGKIIRVTRCGLLVPLPRAAPNYIPTQDGGSELPVGTPVEILEGPFVAMDLSNQAIWVLKIKYSLDEGVYQETCVQARCVES